MLTLDVRTLSLFLALVSVLQAVVLLLYYAVGPRYNGVQQWVWAAGFNAFSFVLLLLRGLIPDVISISLGNGMLLAGMYVFYTGTNRFSGREHPWQGRFLALLLLLSYVVFLPPVFQHVTINLRTFLLSVCAATTYGLCAWNIASSVSPELRHSYHFSAGVFGIYAVWSIIRAVLIMVEMPLASVFTPTTQQIVAFVVLIVAIMLWTAGLMTMCVQRLLHDLEIAQTSERLLLQDTAREARAREQLFRLTFEQSPIGAALVGLDGRLLQVNQSLCAITCYHASALLGRDQRSIIAPDDLATDGQHFQALLDGTVESYSQEHRFVRNGGTTGWVQVSSRMMRDAVGYPLHVLSLIEDVSARKLAESALRLRIDELLALNQIAQALASWTDLASGLASVSPVLRHLFAAEGITIWSRQGDVLLLLLAQRGNHSKATGVALPLDATDTTRQLLAQPLAQMMPLAHHNPLIAAIAPQNNSQDMCQSLLVPLRARNETIGLMCLCVAQADHIYTPNDVALSQIVGGVLGSALDNAHLFAEAQRMAAEQERRHLARELHDSVSQALFAANRTAEVLPQLWELDPDEGRDTLNDLRRLTSSALAEMRTLLLELRPTALAETPLHETLGQLVSAIATHSTTTLCTELQPVPLLPGDVQVALYRIAQEALNNVGKHAQACRVQVCLLVEPPFVAGGPWRGVVRMTIRDDGCGFVPTHPTSSGMGLVSMQERAADVGADLALASTPGHGTKIQVTWHGSARQQGGSYE